MSNPFNYTVPTEVKHVLEVIEDTFMLPGHRFDTIEVYRADSVVETYTYQPALTVPVGDGFVVRFMLDSGKESALSMAVVPKGFEAEDEGDEESCDDCDEQRCDDCPDEDLVDESVESEDEVDSSLDYDSKEEVSDEMSQSSDTEQEDE